MTKSELNAENLQLKAQLEAECFRAAALQKAIDEFFSRRWAITLIARSDGATPVPQEWFNQRLKALQGLTTKKNVEGG